MSRSYNTMPYKIQKERYKSEPWRFKGYPASVGGAWPGRKAYATYRNRQFRAQCKQALLNNREMPIWKRKVAWDIW